MFSNTKASNSPNNRIDTLIGTSASITGNIVATGVIRVDGKHTGDIFTESDIVIGEGGYVKGDLKAVNVTILGNVEGNISCSGTLEILPTGSLTGDVEVTSFAIGKGGIFNGNFSMVNKDIKKLKPSSETSITG